MQNLKASILLKKILLEFEKVANLMLQKYDLTVAQYKILKYLYMHQDEKIRLIDLEKYYSLTHPTAIGLVEQLEKKEFVIRRVNPQNARSRLIILSDKAMKMKDQLVAIGDDMEDMLTEVLTTEERKQLILLLEKLWSSFDKEKRSENYNN